VGIGARFAAEAGQEADYVRNMTSLSVALGLKGLYSLKEAGAERLRARESMGTQFECGYLGSLRSSFHGRVWAHAQPC